MASIHKRKDRPNKPWQVKYRTVEGDQRAESFRTLDEAKAFASSVDVDLRSGTYVDPQRGAVRFGELVPDAMAALELGWRPSTITRARVTLRARVLPRWANVPFGAIDQAAVQGWIRDMTADGLVPGSVGKAFQLFARIVDAAVDARILPNRPWGKNLRLPRAERHEARFLEPAEVDRLAAAIGDEHRAFVYLGALCGLRPGELFALRWPDVDTAAATVAVHATVTEGNGARHVGPPKTKASRRVVPMPAVVVDELELHALTRTDPGGLVFPGAFGKPWWQNAFRRRVWIPATEAGGLGGLVPHELRHSAVAAWIDAGATPNECAARAGHSSVVRILDLYGHRFPRHAQRVNAALDEMYREARQRARD